MITLVVIGAALLFVAGGIAAVSVLMFSDSKSSVTFKHSK